MKTPTSHSPLDLTIPKLPKVPLLSKQTIKWGLCVVGASVISIACFAIPIEIKMGVITGVYIVMLIDAIYTPAR